ncbi:non-canonical poly(A) RNA polymerase protein Trf4-1-like isoform X2 [Hylaeus volcanicus]|nr:non-canonical poly(A) RNA polymerase protein Trf4-1-like isoform X2 [Hylaeus volcanicus]
MSQQIVPLRTSVPSHFNPTNPCIFSQFCCSDKQPVGGFQILPLDTEVIERQEAINKKLRDLLKTNIKPPKKNVPYAPSDSITIALPSKTQSITSSASSSSNMDESSSRATTTKQMAVDEVSQESSHTKDSVTPSDLSQTTSSIFSVSVPRLLEGDPPWYYFLGFNGKNSTYLRKKKQSIMNKKKTRIYKYDWVSALHDINENLDFFGRFHEELHALLLWLDPTPEEILLRQRVLAKITLVAKSLWPNCTVTPFGSYYTGLWLPVGDMDISIMDVEGSQILNLKMLTISLARLGIPVAVEVISSARVPIVKYIDSETGISVDLSLNTESAMDTSHFICRQLELYPWLRPLIMIIKLFLYQRRLGETYRGGIGSYLLFVLCLSFLQQHKILACEKLSSSVGLGHLVLDFFKLYGMDFNYDAICISVRNGGRYINKDKKHWMNTDKPGMLAVESPLAPDMDIGRNSFEIRTVRNCFRQSFLDLAEVLTRWNKNTFDRRESIVNRFIFTTDPLMTYRHRTPFIFSNETKLESSLWWQSIKGYFNQPVGTLRPKPTLCKELLKQVEKDIFSAGNSIEKINRKVLKKKRDRIDKNAHDFNKQAENFRLTSKNNAIDVTHSYKTSKKEHEKNQQRSEENSGNAVDLNVLELSQLKPIEKFLQSSTTDKWDKTFNN